MELKNPTRNVIGTNDALFSIGADGRFISPESFSTSWTITNATLSISSELFVDPLHYCLKFRPNDPSLPVVLTLSSIIPEDNDINGGRAQFHCRVFTSLTESTTSGNAGQVSCKLTNVVSTENSSVQKQLDIAKWTSVFSPVVDVGIVDTDVNTIEFSVELTFENIGGFDVYLTLPILMNELGFVQNTFVYNMRKFIPGFIWDRDKIQEYPNYRFAKLFHALTHYGSLSANLYSKFYQHANVEVPLNYIDNEYRYSKLINPTYVDADYVDWLSQFNGTPIYRTIKTGTSTEAIGDVDDSITWQLENAYFGRNAGTLLAIKECAKQVLSGNKVIYAFPGGSFFQINVYTLLSETPGVTSAGDTSPEVIAMIEKTKPMGFVLSHEAYTSLPFILDDPTFGQLGGPTAPTAPGLA